MSSRRAGTHNPSSGRKKATVLTVSNLRPAVYGSRLEAGTTALGRGRCRCRRVPASHGMIDRITHKGSACTASLSPFSSRSLIPPTPALAARCGGDFNTFVASDVGGGRSRRHLAGSDLPGARRRHAGHGGAEFRPAPARHLQQVVRAICLDPRRARPHQCRPGDAAAPCARCCRASSRSSACRGRSWSRSGGWRPISARATWASCRCSACSRPWRMIAAAPSCSRASCWRR